MFFLLFPVLAAFALVFIWSHLPTLPPSKWWCGASSFFYLLWLTFIFISLQHFRLVFCVYTYIRRNHWYRFVSFFSRHFAVVIFCLIFTKGSVNRTQYNCGFVNFNLFKNTDNCIRYSIKSIITTNISMLRCRYDTAQSFVAIYSFSSSFSVIERSI